LIAFFGPLLLRTPTAPEIETLDEEFPNGDGIDPAMESEAVTPITSKYHQLFKRGGSKEASITSLPLTDVESGLPPRISSSADAVLIGSGDVDKQIINQTDPPT